MSDPAPHPIAPDDPQHVIASAWQDEALWSEVANRLSRSIDAWRLRAAAASVSGVFLMVLVANLGPGNKSKPVMATAAVLLLALVPYLRQKLVSNDQLSAWTRARNVSEQLKAAIYRHLMGALDPLPMADGHAAPDPTGPGNLVRHCRRIKEAVADLALQASLTSVAPPSPPRPTAMRIDGYLTDRLEDQISYFCRAGRREAERAHRLQQAELGLGLLTVLVGALVGNLLPIDLAHLPQEVLGKLPEDAQRQLAAQSSQAPILQPLLVLLAALTAAVGAHMTGTRALVLAGTCFGMHEHLRSLRDEWRVDPARQTPQRVLRLVREVEDALAREHDGWMTDWKALLQQADNGPGTPAPAPDPGPGADRQPDAPPRTDP